MTADYEIQNLNGIFLLLVIIIDCNDHCSDRKTFVFVLSFRNYGWSNSSIVVTKIR